MPHYPDLETFENLAREHQIVPVFRRLLSDNLTPVNALFKLDKGASSCLFESVVGGEKVGRYSFLAAQPFWRIRAYGNRVVIEADGRREEFHSENPLHELRRRLDALSAARPEGLPPFAGGVVGYAGYDVVRYAEHLPNAPYDDRQLPDLSFAFYDQMVVFDNVTKTMYVIVSARIENGESAAQAYQNATARVDALVACLSTASSTPAPADIATAGDLHSEPRSNFKPEAFKQAVRECVKYIEAGDIFQVVLSQRYEVDLTASPLEVYRTLRVVNPSPFMFYLRTPECTLVGSSPEIMCRVKDNVVTVRPLAGTRPRGENEQQDAALAEELLADPKERAEHVMLVDLGRNDVGRVARFGSVQLTDCMTIERYSHVMHISSNVDGVLRHDCDAFDALQASLPAGTVSGAPKVRAMEIIDELEPNRRGPYAGAVGYIDLGGNMDTCIALRTIVIQNGKAYVQAGAGIVADSDPEAEFQETRNKARGLLKAIEITEERVRE